jgi:Secretion system C-terminal sorting domain/SprB repeat
MFKKLFKTVLVLFLFSATSFAQKPSLSDLFGRPILAKDGGQIKYHKEQTPLLEKAPINPTVNDFLGIAAKEDTVTENFSNLYTVMGERIGEYGMETVDIDGDGKLEIICTAYTLLNANTNISGDFWYVMSFDGQTNTCTLIWTSLPMEGKITSLAVLDINNDKKYKIFIGLSNGTLSVYDAQTKQLDKKATIEKNNGITSILYADADNDGVKDIVTANGYNCYILDAKTLAPKSTIKDKGKIIRVGNVDGDSKNEICSASGNIYELSGLTEKAEWTFDNSFNLSGALIELSDLDKDGMAEIIFTSGWYSILVYDADTKTTKYTIKTDLDVDVIKMIDTNNDGTDEIVYGDGQWGEIHCINHATQKELWQVKNPTHGVTCLNFIDLDNNGKKELVWGSGGSSSGADYLYIYDLVQSKVLWRSEDVSSPFYAITSGDVDGDNKPEIVAVSFRSESNYEGGVLFIIDPVTNKVKWQSPTSFLKNTWDGVFCVQINDIDKDGTNDIVIAADNVRTGKIWIVNGITHAIKSSYEFKTEKIGSFQAMAIEDIDNDNNVEIIAAAKDQVYVINPITFAIKWKVTIKPSPYNYTTALKCADVDGDGKKEIVYCGGSLQIINTTDQSLWTNLENNFTNFDLFDYNADKTLDIVLSNDKGQIKILDGKSKTYIKEINADNNKINGVKVLSYNKANVILYSSKGRIHYFLNDNNKAIGQPLGSDFGLATSFQLFPTDKGFDFVIGTALSILKVSGATLNCISLISNATQNEVSCNKQNGKIKLNVAGGSPPYQITWNDNSTMDSLVNQKAGKYSVKIQDKNGCIKSEYFTLANAYIDANVTTKNASCNNQKGTALLEIKHGTAPYDIKWSNNTNGNLNNSDLLPGFYFITVTDAQNCKFEKNFNIKKDSLVILPNITEVTCNGNKDGGIYLSTSSGTNPLQYKWQNGWTGAYLDNLKAGTYAVTVSDAAQCKTFLNLKVTEPDKITYNLLTSPDNINTSAWDGKIIINGIKGGKPPYVVYWPDLNLQTTFINGLPNGDYLFVITDDNNCTVSGKANIGSTTANKDVLAEEMLDVFPNPVNESINIIFKDNTVSYFYLELFDVNGRLIYTSKNEGTYSPQTIDVSNISNGLFLLSVHTNNKKYYKKISIQH